MKIKKLKISSYPNSENLKILAIGDPHGDLQKIKKIPIRNVDLILLTGDLGKSDLMRKMHFENIERMKKGLPKIEYSSQEKKKAFMEAYDSTIASVKYLAKFAPVYTVFGNVENSNAYTRDYSKELGLKLPFIYKDLKKIKGVRVINKVIANFNGIRIGGLEYFIDTSWVREFRPSSFREKLAGAKQETDKAKRILRNFRYVDILLAHQPPYGILDQVKFKGAPKDWFGKHAGSKTILDYIKSRQPQYVFCGHIHEAEGMKKIGKTQVYNLGVCGYKIIDIHSN